MQKESYNRNREKIPDYVLWMSRWLDTKFQIPGTRFRFGLDPVIGLIPGLGDVFTFVVSGSLIAVMARKGASGKVIILMTLNALLDTIIGSIPLLGGIFDFFYKANERNVRILEKHYHEGKYQGSGKGIVVLVIIVLLAVFAGAIYLIWNLFEWIISNMQM